MVCKSYRVFNHNDFKVFHNKFTPYAVSNYKPHMPLIPLWKDGFCSCPIRSPLSPLGSQSKRFNAGTTYDGLTMQWWPFHILLARY